MLTGLGLLLRKCGVDTVLLKPEDDHDSCVKVALSEGRMVITKGKNNFRRVIK